MNAANTIFPISTFVSSQNKISKHQNKVSFFPLTLRLRHSHWFPLPIAYFLCSLYSKCGRGSRNEDVICTRKICMRIIERSLWVFDRVGNNMYPLSVRQCMHVMFLSLSPTAIREREKQRTSAYCQRPFSGPKRLSRKQDKKGPSKTHSQQRERKKHKLEWLTRLQEMYHAAEKLKAPLRLLMIE